MVILTKFPIDKSHSFEQVKNGFKTDLEPSFNIFFELKIGVNMKQIYKVSISLAMSSITFVPFIL